MAQFSSVLSTFCLTQRNIKQTITWPERFETVFGQMLELISRLEFQPDSKTAYADYPPRSRLPLIQGNAGSGQAPYSSAGR